MIVAILKYIYSPAAIQLAIPPDVFISSFLSKAVCNPSTLEIIWLWLSSATVVVIVTSPFLFYVVDPLTPPERAIVLAVVNLDACKSWSVEPTLIFEIDIFVISPLFKPIKKYNQKCVD